MCHAWPVSINIKRIYPIPKQTNDFLFLCYVNIWCITHIRTSIHHTNISDFRFFKTTHAMYDNGCLDGHSHGSDFTLLIKVLSLFLYIQVTSYIIEIVLATCSEAYIPNEIYLYPPENCVFLFQLIDCMHLTGLCQRTIRLDLWEKVKPVLYYVIKKCWVVVQYINELQPPII